MLTASVSREPRVELSTAERRRVHHADESHNSEPLGVVITRRHYVGAFRGTSREITIKSWSSEAGAAMGKNGVGNFPNHSRGNSRGTIAGITSDEMSPEKNRMSSV